MQIQHKTYYEPGNEQAKTLLQILEQMLTELFKLAGYDEAFSQKTIAQALAYDKKLAPFQKDSLPLLNQRAPDYRSPLKRGSHRSITRLDQEEF